MALVFYLQRWHLFAWDRSKLDYRDFRTDRMRDLQPTGDKFAVRKNFRLQDHIDRLLNPKQTVTARVKATPLAAERLRREAFLGATDERVTADGVELTLRAANRDWLVNWLLSFGTAISVLSPTDIRRQLSQTAAAVSAQHAKQ
jgi:predicted DNA-binding transcriptional regulator YafY